MTALPNTQPLRVVGSEERKLPASIEAERSVIGASLIRQEIPPECAEMLVDDFLLPAHRAIWEAMVECAKANRKLDPIEVEEQLKAAGNLMRLEGGMSYLLECTSGTPTAENVGHYVRIVREKALLRRLIQLCVEASSRAYGEFSSVTDFVAEVRSKVIELESTGTIAEPVKIGDEMGRVLAAIEERAKAPEKSAVYTKIHRFDRLTGGLREGKLIIVAARPGQGKTAWLGTVATNVASQGVPAFIVSIEMSVDELIERFLASDARVSTEDLATGAVVKTERVGDVFKSAQRLAKMPLEIDDRGTVTIGRICGSIRKWYSRNLGAVPPKGTPAKPAFVGVDYLQIIAEEENEERRDRALGKMTAALKALSKALRLPIVLLSQLNRKAADRAGGRPQLSDLRESGSIEQDADMVIFPHRELPVDEEEAAKARNEPGDMEWVIAKNRGGRCGIVPVHWMPAYTRFDNTLADSSVGNWQDHGDR